MSLRLEKLKVNITAVHDYLQYSFSTGVLPRLVTSYGYSYTE